MAAMFVVNMVMVMVMTVMMFVVVMIVPVIVVMIMVMIVIVPVVVRMFVRFRSVFVVAAIFGIAFGQIVMMKMEKALQEEHRQKAAEHPGDCAVERAQIFFCIGQEM